MHELFYNTLEYLLFMYGLVGITIVVALHLLLEFILKGRCCEITI